MTSHVFHQIISYNIYFLILTPYNVLSTDFNLVCDFRCALHDLEEGFSNKSETSRHILVFAFCNLLLAKIRKAQLCSSEIWGVSNLSQILKLYCLLRKVNRGLSPTEK